MLLCQGGRCRQPQHAGHHRCDHQNIGKRSSCLNRQMQNITNLTNASSPEQTYAIMKGKIMHLGIVHHLHMFQSKHISSSGKRGEKTW